MKHITFLIAAILITVSLRAQIKSNLPIDTAKQDKKHKSSISIGTGGIHYDDGKCEDSNSHAWIQIGMLDVGINTLQDNTNYNSAAAQNFLHVDAAHQGSDLFSLRTSKSINVNVYPVIVKAQLYKSNHQKLTLATGIGLQLYNFRFTKPVSYTSDPTPGVVLDTVSFSKNKLAFNYLTVPLMLNAKTKIGSAWLTYGVGVSGGFLLSSWTKQISDERGKDKNHDPFNFRKTNFCVNGEIGLDGYVRLYASYQLTSLHTDALDQRPFCIGLRFLGI